MADGEMRKETGASPCCRFCELEEERLWLRNDHALAFRDGFPVSKGHSLIVPRRHLVSIFDGTSEEQAACWELVAKVRSALAKEFEAMAFNVGINDGAMAGQTIMHGHIHVIPRYEGDCEDPRGGIRWILPERARYWE